MATPEGLFKAKVIRDLKRTPNCYYFVKEACAIRGIPDIICCINGVFVALELKKDLASTRVKTGRIVLQKHNIEKIKKANGFACLTCPELWDEHLKELKALNI